MNCIVDAIFQSNVIVNEVPLIDNVMTTAATLYRLHSGINEHLVIILLKTL